MFPSPGLRPVRPEDEAFLYEVYASSREAELAAWGWNDAQKEAFLRMQFAAQNRHYRTHYPNAEFLIVQLEERPVGRLTVDRGEDAILIVDIALLPAFQGRGVGAAVIGELIAEADRIGRPVRAAVEQSNRALRFYQRQGFVIVGAEGPYFRIERPFRATDP